MGSLGTVWPKSNEAERGQVGPPEPILAPISTFPKRAPGRKLAKNYTLATGNHQRPPAQVQQAFPSIQKKDSPSLMYSIPRIQAW
ncbi:hypothetical protein O181_013473 [Austropuccinia psidii MF-1]|uniref:Uncharacterized protein n=1 Tax=Austropuccinia psidii MF-1 TaxID=1389203 RepID=A0A9Q3BZA9_9BASI|nr:hypothetical protein [Austropuccinia psidii MF-1]